MARSKKTAVVEAVSLVDSKLGTFIHLRNTNDCSIQAYVYNAVQHIAGYQTAYKFRNGEYPVEFLVNYGEAIKKYLEDDGDEDTSVGEYAKLFGMLDSRIAERKKISEARLKAGVMLFDDILFLFKEGSEVIQGFGEDAIGGVIKSVELRSSFFGPYYKLTMSIISNLSGTVGEANHEMSISYFDGPVNIAEFGLRLISDADRAMLTARGRKYREFSTGSVHASYEGTLIQQSYWSNREYRASGRVMVDMKAFQIIDPDNYRNVTRSYNSDEDEKNREANFQIADDMLWRTVPYLYGFSFAAKQWGRLKVSGLTQINWRDDAFDKLVLDPEQKQLVRALVEHNTGSFSDIVEGKGGGCIFLLHGVPGQGKTLTAETVAELLHKPLYMISVGELGTNPDQLEERLRIILDLATMWDAVLLLDEADIFLEARNETDVLRNAMVGVFLRLLEYHQGVLFLTTNRVRNIDDAFFSRISVALKFPGSDEEKRTKIWNNLLDAAQIGGIDVSKLAGHDINGRQIKNSIRLAQTLARAEEREITFEHIERTINLTTSFKKDVEKGSE